MQESLENEKSLGKQAQTAVFMHICFNGCTQTLLQILFFFWYLQQDNCCGLIRG